jgi:putative membrane protein
MIRGYGDHAANERTFLAWLRTSIAVVALSLPHFGAGSPTKLREGEGASV